MSTKNFLILLSLLSLSLACGGGGGGSGGSGGVGIQGGGEVSVGDETPEGPPVSVSGVALKGTLSFQLYQIYHIKADSTRGELVDEGRTGDRGLFEVSLPSGGLYEISISANAEHHCEIANAVVPLGFELLAWVDLETRDSSDPVSMSVTPLTTVAVQSVRKTVEAMNNYGGGAGYGMMMDHRMSLPILYLDMIAALSEWVSVDDISALAADISDPNGDFSNESSRRLGLLAAAFNGTGLPAKEFIELVVSDISRDYRFDGQGMDETGAFVDLEYDGVALSHDAIRDWLVAGLAKVETLTVTNLAGETATLRAAISAHNGDLMGSSLGGQNPYDVSEVCWGAFFDFLKSKTYILPVSASGHQRFDMAGYYSMDMGRVFDPALIATAADYHQAEGECPAYSVYSDMKVFKKRVGAESCSLRYAVCDEGSPIAPISAELDTCSGLVAIPQYDPGAGMYDDPSSYEMSTDAHIKIGLRIPKALADSGVLGPSPSGESRYPAVSIHAEIYYENANGGVFERANVAGNSVCMFDPAVDPDYVRCTLMGASQGSGNDSGGVPLAAVKATISRIEMMSYDKEYEIDGDVASFDVISGGTTQACDAIENNAGQMTVRRVNANWSSRSVELPFDPERHVGRNTIHTMAQVVAKRAIHKGAIKIFEVNDQLEKINEIETLSTYLGEARTTLKHGRIYLFEATGGEFVLQKTDAPIPFTDHFETVVDLRSFASDATGGGGEGGYAMGMGSGVMIPQTSLALALAKKRMVQEGISFDEAIRQSYYALAEFLGVGNISHVAYAGYMGAGSSMGSEDQVNRILAASFVWMSQNTHGAFSLSEVLEIFAQDAADGQLDDLKKDGAGGFVPTELSNLKGKLVQAINDYVAYPENDTGITDASVITQAIENHSGQLDFNYNPNI